MIVDCKLCGKANLLESQLKDHAVDVIGQKIESLSGDKTSVVRGGRKKNLSELKARLQSILSGMRGKKKAATLQDQGVKEIEELNILHASLLAMKRAIKKLKKKPVLVLIDGNKVPQIENYNLKPIIKGDKKIPSISAASIIAKVSRDKMVTKLGKKFKGYYWDQNYGYGTKQHLKAIKKLGITPQHRKTFSPINRAY